MSLQVGKNNTTISNQPTGETFISPTQSFSDNYDGLMWIKGGRLIMHSSKGEGNQINIGLGRGEGLEIFNSSIVDSKKVGGN